MFLCGFGFGFVYESGACTGSGTGAGLLFKPLLVLFLLLDLPAAHVVVVEHHFTVFGLSSSVQTAK